MVSPTLVEIGQLIVAIAIPVAGGFLGSTFGGGDSDWYKKLNKPSWTPPNWVFPVVWTILYVMMGVASFLVYREGGFRAEAFPLGAYVVQLVFNFGWTPIFFGLQRPDLGFCWIVLLLLAIVNNIYFFYTVNRVAAYLLIPLLLWGILATSLNWYIFRYNPLPTMPPSEITTRLHGGPGTPSV